MMPGTVTVEAGWDGRIVDAGSGEPIAGATISRVGSNDETVSGLDGSFVFQPIIESGMVSMWGTALVEKGAFSVSKDGYEDVVVGCRLMQTQHSCNSDIQLIALDPL
jgi:hypothetical protein